MARTYGPWTVQLLGLRIGEGDMSRAGNNVDRMFDAIRTPAWGYSPGNYGFNSYQRTDLTLQTLESLVGPETMARVLRTYHERWRFRHPSSEDFYDVVGEVAGPLRRSYFERTVERPGILDDEAPASRPAAPDAALLRAGADAVDETLVTHGFRSVCPVTGQPDYASIAIAYRGPRLDRAALAAYLFGYRLHPGFHEHCVERIFTDIARICRPGLLRVEARFTRRGGVDINPVRATSGMPLAPSAPTFRQ